LIELLPATEPHRRRAVEQEVDRQILLFLVQAHEQATEAVIHVPVDGTDVVAGHVVTVIGELDTAALLLAAALGAGAPAEHPAAHEREHLELALELVVEELHRVRGRLLRLLALEQVQEGHG
jgi:hypothetical protein